MWIQTMRGRGVDLLDPKPEDICPVELSILAGRLGRFGNHTRIPYTVAEHSWRVSKLCPSSLALAGLLHDGHETYLGFDLPRPVKELLAQHTNLIAVIEAAWDKAIGERFDIDPQLFHSPAVKEFDDVLLATERRDQMGPCDRPWKPLPSPLDAEIRPFREPGVLFARRLMELTGEAFDLEPVRRNTLEPVRGLAAVAHRQHLTSEGGAPDLASRERVIR